MRALLSWAILIYTRAKYAMASIEVLLSFGTGLAAVGLIYAGVRLCRSRASHSPLLAELLASRVQYALAGVVFGLLAPLNMRPVLGAAADLATSFLVGIFGLVVGCSVELRLLKNTSRLLLLLEIGYLVLLGLGLWVLSYGFSPEGVEGATLWGVCGLCAACWMRQGRRGGSTKKKLSSGWLPSASALAGLFIAGVGFMQRGPGGFEVRLPLAFPSIVVEGMWAKYGACLVLGALIGLIVDLATRGLGKGYLYYVIAAGLLLGSGMAGALGLEPLWVGAVAGIWLVNATMRRLDILRSLEQGQDMVRTVLPGVAGWALGAALIKGGLEFAFGAWVFLALVAVVPGVRLAMWHGMRQMFNRSVDQRTGVEPRQLLELDDLGLVIALSLAAFLPAGQGAALLVAVLLGQRLMHVVAVWTAGKLSAA